MTQLERYEWCDLWWEEAASADKPRILLIGDSITRAYHPYVKELLREDFHVDRLATSKAIDNPSLLREIGYMLEQGERFRYEAIHFNNGLHGWHVGAGEYELNYAAVLDRMTAWTEAKLVLALSTPVWRPGGRSEPEPELNGKVLERNAAVDRLAAARGLAVNDLYGPMADRGDYRTEDGFHYNTEGQKAQAVLVAAAIARALRG